MAGHLSGYDILDSAMIMEQNGKLFYEMLAGKTLDMTVKELCKDLAKDEGKHERIFADLREDIASEILPFSGDQKKRLEGIAADSVFTEDTAKKFKDVLANEELALAYALELERSSIDFYEQLAPFIANDDARVVDMIIAEEEEHASALETKLNDLRKRSA